MKTVEEKRAYEKAWRAANVDKIREHQAKYRAANQDKINAYHRARRVRINQPVNDRIRQALIAEVARERRALNETTEED